MLPNKTSHGLERLNSKGIIKQKMFPRLRARLEVAVYIPIFNETNRKGVVALKHRIFIEKEIRVHVSEFDSEIVFYNESEKHAAFSRVVENDFGVKFGHMHSDFFLDSDVWIDHVIILAHVAGGGGG